MLKTKEDVLKEVKRQLSMFLINERRTIEWLENESLTEAEYSIASLAIRIGYNTTGEMLRAEFGDCVTFIGDNLIQAGPELYNTPELQHIISLQERTVLKERNKPKIRAPESATPVERRRPRHVYGDENCYNEILIRRHRIIEELPPLPRRSARIEKKKASLPTPIVKRSSRRLSTNRFRLDARQSAQSDLMDNVVALTNEYGFGKPAGRLTSLHLANLTVPAIVDWAFMLKRISNITSKFAKVTLINDVTPNMLFLDELHSSYGIKNKRGETFYDTKTGNLYSVYSGVLKSRRYRISFLIQN